MVYRLYDLLLFADKQKIMRKEGERKQHQEEHSGGLFRNEHSGKNTQERTFRIHRIPFASRPAGSVKCPPGFHSSVHRVTSGSL